MHSGFHICKGVWTHAAGVVLLCEMEDKNLVGPVGGIELHKYLKSGLLVVATTKPAKSNSKEFYLNV